MRVRAPRKLRILVESCRALGVGHTIRSTCAHVLTQMADVVNYRPEKARAFDRRFQTDTASSVDVEELGIADRDARQAAVLYVPTPVPLVRYMLRKLGVDHRNYQFVDYGCGKGRVLMVASEFPFRSIHGVEISPALSEIAGRNLQVFRSPRQQCADIDVRCIDARDYPLADMDTVFHFYHPFEGDVLRQVVEKIATTFRASGRHAQIIYSWHSVQQLFPLFEELGFTSWGHTRTVHPRYQFAFFALAEQKVAADDAAPADGRAVERRRGWNP